MSLENPAVRLGHTLRQLREERDRSVEEVAAQVDIAPDDLRAIESGETLPTVDVLLALSDEYGVAGTMFARSGKPAGPLVTPEPQGPIQFALGANGEEARENLRRKKAAEVPHWPIELRPDTTEPELMVALIDPLRLIEEQAVLVNSFLVTAPERLMNSRFGLSARTMLREVFINAWHLRTVLQNKPVDMSTFLLNEMRKGVEITGITIKPGREEM